MITTRSEASSGLAATAILESLPFGVVVVDHEDRIAYLNRKAEALLGASRERWSGAAVRDFADYLERSLACSGFRTHLEKAAAEPEICSSRELTIQTGRQEAHIRMDSAPYHDLRGTVVGRVFTYHDVSRERSIDQRKTEFIGVASHELRTPLTSIKGALDLVLSGFTGDISPEIREMLAIAQKNCQRLVRMVSEILDLAKIEAGQTGLTLQLLDPIIPVENAVRGLRPYARQHGVTLRLEPSGARALVLLDEDRIEQVVTNLISNAIKFSPPNGVVRVHLSGGGEWVECSVADQGCGIAKEDLPKLFGKFQQLANGKSAEGTGLGLAIARELVKQHKGEIWAESTVGEGSVFSFRLPADLRVH